MEKPRLYKDGDLVIINKYFIIENYTGKFISGKLSAAKIEKAVYTPTYGWSYTLSQAGKTFPVCYWEDNIVGLQIEDEELWKIWGDN